MFCPAVLTDDSGSDKPGPVAADGAESELGTDGVSDKYGTSSACLACYQCYSGP